MNKRLVITGATSNLGIAVLEKLRSEDQDVEIMALVRNGSNTGILRTLGVAWLECDLAIPSTYKTVLGPESIVIAIAHRSLTDAMLPTLSAAKVQQCYAVTSTTVFVEHHPEVAEYRAIEERMRNSAVPVTILRPSMLYGRGKDQNISRLVRMMSKIPVMPVFGSGERLLQPVYVDDVAEALVNALHSGAKGEYNLAGPQAITYNQLLHSTARALGRRVFLIHIPQKLAEILVSGLQRLPRFPIEVNQVRRLSEDKAYDISKAKHELQYFPRSFEEGIKAEVSAVLSGNAAMSKSRS